MTRRDWQGDPIFEAATVTIPITDEMLARGSKVIFDHGGIPSSPFADREDGYIGYVRKIVEAVLVPPADGGAALPGQDKSVALRMEVTPALTYALYDALQDWMSDRDFLSPDEAAAMIVRVVEEKGLFRLKRTEDREKPGR